MSDARRPPIPPDPGESKETTEKRDNLARGQKAAERRESLQNDPGSGLPTTPPDISKTVSSIPPGQGQPQSVSRGDGDAYARIGAKVKTGRAKGVSAAKIERMAKLQANKAKANPPIQSLPPFRVKLSAEPLKYVNDDMVKRAKEAAGVSQQLLDNMVVVAEGNHQRLNELLNSDSVNLIPNVDPENKSPCKEMRFVLKEDGALVVAHEGRPNGVDIPAHSQMTADGTFDASGMDTDAKLKRMQSYSAKSAGNLVFDENNVLVEISNKSGDFHPSLDTLQEALISLRDAGVKMADTVRIAEATSSQKADKVYECDTGKLFSRLDQLQSARMDSANLTDSGPALTSDTPKLNS